MANVQVVDMLASPKSKHVYAPHCHHSQSICFSNEVSVTHVHQTVEHRRQRVLTNMVGWLLRCGYLIIKSCIHST